MTDENLQWFLNLEVTPASKIMTKLVWMEDGSYLEGSEGSNDLHFHGNTLYFNADPDTKKSIRNSKISQSILGRLKDLNMTFNDDGTIALRELMDEEIPEDFSKILDQLQIPKFQEEEQIDQSRFFSDTSISKPDEENREDEKENVDKEIEDEVISEETLDQQSLQSSFPNDELIDEEKIIDEDENEFDRRKEKGSEFLGTTINPRRENNLNNESPGKRNTSSRQNINETIEVNRDLEAKENLIPPKKREPSNTQRSKDIVSRVYDGLSEPTPKDEESIEHEKKVDAAAIKKVLELEEKLGRHPTGMDHENHGYDIESKDSKGNILRYIEVKGLGKKWTTFQAGLSSRQYEECEDRGDDFWLYVVENALDDENYQISRIRNPKEKITRYLFDPGWKGLSENWDIEPEVGKKVLQNGRFKGTVTEISPRGLFKTIKIKTEKDESLLIPLPDDSISFEN